MVQAANNNFGYKNELKKKKKENKIVHLGFRFRINENFSKTNTKLINSDDWTRMIDNTSFYVETNWKYIIKFIWKLIFKKIEFKNSSIIHNFLSTVLIFLEKQEITYNNFIPFTFHLIFTIIHSNQELYNFTRT